MIVTNSCELKQHIAKKTSVALGSFDAIHRGHIKVIGEAVAYAKENGLLSLVQIFDMLPDIKGERENVNTLSMRLEILEELGADIVVIEQFDKAFRETPYREFAVKYLKELYNAAAVFAGDNYRFGYCAEGDTDKLAAECDRLGIKAKIIRCVEQGGVISSTRIRECIKGGEVEKAAELMTRPYSVEGSVIHGRGVGNTIGFPTANIDLPQNRLLPNDGVYLTRVTVDGQCYMGITNIGAKPTVKVEKRNIETYISDYNGNLYGKEIRVEFLKRIRDIKRFDNLCQLREQLEKDKEYIKRNV